MKKIIVGLVLSLTLILTACGDKGSEFIGKYKLERNPTNISEIKKEGKHFTRSSWRVGNEKGKRTYSATIKGKHLAVNKQGSELLYSLDKDNNLIGPKNKKYIRIK